MPDERSNYEKGMEAGRIIETLGRHEDHLKVINGSQTRVVEQLAEIRLMLQQVIDTADSRAASSRAEMKARDALVITVRDALKEKEDDRRDSSNQKWTPWQRILFVAGGVATVVGAVVTIIATR